MKSEGFMDQNNRGTLKEGRQDIENARSWSERAFHWEAE